MFRRIAAFLVAAVLACGPVAAASMPCPSAVSVASVGEDCMAAMARKREKPDKQCIEHCAALTAAACVLPVVSTLSATRLSKAFPNRVADAQLRAVSVELNTPPPRTIA